MTAKCITDGFGTSRKKSGDGAGAVDGIDGAGAFSKLAKELVDAANAEFSTAVGFEQGALTTNLTLKQNLQAFVTRFAPQIANLDKLSGQQLAQTAVVIGNRLGIVSVNASKAGMPQTSVTAANGKSLCFRIAQAVQKEIRNQGRLNTKELNDSPVRPVKTADLDGREVTKYTKTGGREPR